MNTSRCIATISYNTVSFLNGKLQELLKMHIISDYFYIFHYHEEDESSDHIHLWIKPNKRIDTMMLQDMFLEPDPSDPLGRPLGCIDFCTSDPDEAIPYFAHNVRYLTFKKESRVYEYRKEDFKYADQRNFDELWRHAFRSSKWNSRLTETELLADPYMSGYELVTSGYIDWTKASAVLAMERLADRHTDRNNRPGHEDNRFCDKAVRSPDSQPDTMSG